MLDHCNGERSLGSALVLLQREDVAAAVLSTRVWRAVLVVVAAFGRESLAARVLVLLALQGPMPAELVRLSRVYMGSGINATTDARTRGSLTVDGRRNAFEIVPGITDNERGILQQCVDVHVSVYVWDINNHSRRKNDDNGL